MTLRSPLPVQHGARPRRRAGRVLALAGVAAILLVTFSGALAAQESADAGYVQVQAVDATDAASPTLDVLFPGDESTLENATLRENGDEVEVVDVTRDTDDAGVVLVLDNSQVGRDSRSFGAIKDAATQIVNELPAGTEVGLVTVGGGAHTARPLTDDREAALGIVEDLTVEGGPSLVDGVLTASSMFDDETDLDASVVVLSAAPDAGSGSSVVTARGRAERNGAAVHAVGIGGADPQLLAALTSTTGGQLLTAGGDEAQDLGEAMAATLNGRYRVQYESRVEAAGDVVDLSVTAGGATTDVTFVAGSERVGYSRIAPRAADGSSGGISIFQNEMAKTLAIVVALVAATLFAYGLISTFVQDQPSLDRILRSYSDDPTAEGEDGDGNTNLAQTALLQRAVEFTEDFAERQHFLTRAEALLERANVPLRAAEGMLFYAAGVVVVLLLAVVVTGNPIIALILTGFAAATPIAWINLRASQRQKKFMAQLPDTLQLLAGTLRAGYSLMQGVEAVSQEVDDPMGDELRRVVTESRLGRPLEESLEASAQRLDSPDFSWAVMAIQIQREVGGNLSELLMTVAETMVARERLRREVAALTAEGKISAIVLGILPIALAAVMFVINPEYIGLLISERIGNFMLGGGVMLALFGFWWMKKTIEVEV